MGKYRGVLCEHCKRAFTDDDDIVVCPQCGAPHHRECYNELKHCALADKHTADFEWKPTYAESHAGAGNQAASVICPNCNSANLPGSRFCCMCQYPLDSANINSEHGRYNYNYDNSRAQYNDYDGSVFTVGGVDSNELTAYTGSGFHYYIPRFRMISRSKWGVSWNWAALIFGGFYFLYRKMYKLAALLFIFNVVSLLPTLLCFFGETDASMELLGGITVFYNSQLMQKLSPLAMFLEQLGTIINVTCALFANKIYLSSAISNIMRCKEDNRAARDTKEYYDELYFLGKPSIVPVMVVIALFILFYSYCGGMMTYTMH